MAPDDESFKELNDSIEQFERAIRSARQLIREPAPRRPLAAWRRWQRLWRPVVIAGLALLAFTWYLGRGDQVEPAPAALVDSAAPRTPTTPTVIAPAQGSVAAENRPDDATRQQVDADAPTQVAAPAEPPRAETSSATSTDSETVVDNAASDSSLTEDRPPVASDARTVEIDAAARVSEPRQYAIQVAAYNRNTLATARADRLAAVGFPSYVVEARQDAGQTVFRVRIGAYSDRQAAEAAGQRIRAEEALDWYLVIWP